MQINEAHPNTFTKHYVLIRELTKINPSHVSLDLDGWLCRGRQKA